MEQRTTTTVVRQVNPFSYIMSTLASIVWFIIALIMLLIAIRIVLLLLGAGNAGIVNTIYDWSNIFVGPFAGIFPSTTYNGSFFDAAALIAFVVYGIAGVVITWILRFFSRA